jgi:alpha-L-fucosidase
VKGNTIYLHVFQWPTDGKLIVGNLQGTPVLAYFLADTEKIPLQTRRINDSDLEVNVGETAKDPTDTVVALEMDGPVHGTKGRLLATNVAENQLLAFDATAKGKFKYGDGKAEKYYAAGFDRADEFLAWPIRLNAPATFDVSVRCSAQAGTDLVVAAGDHSTSAVAQASDSKTSVVVELGKLSLPAGEQELRFRPLQRRGMRLFEVSLKPVR